MSRHGNVPHRKDETNFVPIPYDTPPVPDFHLWHELNKPQQNNADLRVEALEKTEGHIYGYTHMYICMYI